MKLQNCNSSDGLNIEAISKSFGRNLVLDDLSFEVERGHLVSLLGPSGCGKTTTLNMIAGFENPDSGTIRLGGKEIVDLPPNRRDTAIVFQNYALFPHMTVYKNIAYGLKVRKKDSIAIKSTVERMADMLGLSPALLERYPGELSGGQQQRVSLARAIAVEPSLLLLDEPLSNLDAKLRQEIRVEIRRLQQELKQTAVFVTHDQEEALVISDYIAVLKEGRLEQFGTPADLWERPRTVYVADFMGVENIIAVSDSTDTSSASVLARSIVSDRYRNYSHVGFRPSSASLNDEWERVEGDSLRIPVTTISKSYMGTHNRYVCAIRGTDFELTVDQKLHDRQFAQGEEVSLSVSSNNVLGLSSDSSSPVPSGAVSVGAQP